MNANGFSQCDQSHSYKPVAAGDHRSSGFTTHLALALSRYVRELRHEGTPAPAEIEELAAVLAHFVRSRLDATVLDQFLGETHSAGVAGRLLVTKAEAAERLGVSVRTIERLVAADQLPIVHVERAAWLRVSDLEAYVQNLTDAASSPSDASDSAPAEEEGRSAPWEQHKDRA